MQSNCINLKDRWGHLYRITFDPSYDAKGKRHLDHWYMQVPCRTGIIYPLGGEYLALELDHHPSIAKRVMLIPTVECVQDGTSEKTFRFHVRLFDQVAALVQPKKKRCLSAEHLAALAEGRAKSDTYNQISNRKGTKL